MIWASSMFNLCMSIFRVLNFFSLTFFKNFVMITVSASLGVKMYVHCDVLENKDNQHTLKD